MPYSPHVGNLPPELGGSAVTFAASDGARLSGWFIPPRDKGAVIILLHGIKDNRAGLLPRARFLANAGYGVLLFDFRGHGESERRRVTFGRDESLDARAAVRYVRNESPGAKVGVIGFSLGGAAVLLANPPLDIDAAVFEAVYATIDWAIANRLEMRLGRWARCFTPVPRHLMRPVMRVDACVLRPVEGAARLAIPKLFIAGTHDRYTTLAESRELFAAAAAPGEQWIVEGARHGDFYQVAGGDYEARILRFFEVALA